jgi:hypothetical protein
VDVVGVASGSLLVHTIERFPIPFILVISGLLYIYNAIQNAVCCHTLISALWDLRVRVYVVGIGGGFLLVLMIETPHSLHTHSRSSSYIYKAISTCYSGYSSQGCCHTLMSALWDLRVDVVGSCSDHFFT